MKGVKGMKISIFMPFVLFVAVVAALTAQAPQPAPTPQAPQQTPVFRSSIDIVPITVTVLDKNGAPIRDLKASDFTVLENKRPREIISFFPQPFEPSATPVAPATVYRTRDDRMTPQTGRTFLIVLGFGRIQVPTRAVDGAIELVRNRLLPQDVVAVMGFHRATNFTTDHEAVARLLERYRADHEKIVLDIAHFRQMTQAPPGSGTGGPPIPEAILKRIDTMFLGPPTADGRANPAIELRRIADVLLGMDRPVPVVEKPWQQQDRLADVLQESRDRGDDINDAVLLSTRNKFFAGVAYLRDLNGEKHMLVFAPNGPRNLDDARILAQRATDARVVVDFVSTTGTNPYGGISGSPASRELAELTGGYYSSVEMASKAVTKLDGATRFSYLLGYAPSSPTLDGRYRDVEVQVNRPGATVRYSHGYFAAAQPPALDLKELMIKSRLDAVLAFDSTAKDIELKVTATQLPRMGLNAETRVEIIIDASKLAFAPAKGAFAAQLEVQVYCGDAKQNIVGELGERLDLQGTEDTIAGWQQNGIRRVVRVPVTDLPKYVKVIVYDYGTDRAGSFMLTMK